MRHDIAIIFICRLISRFLMNYYYYPNCQKITLDTNQIYLFANDPNFKMINFIYGLFKYRCILNNILEKF